MQKLHQNLHKPIYKVSCPHAEHIHIALTKQTDVLSSQLLNSTFGALSVFVRRCVRDSSLRADLCDGWQCVCDQLLHPLIFTVNCLLLSRFFPQGIKPVCQTRLHFLSCGTKVVFILAVCHVWRTSFSCLFSSYGCCHNSYMTENCTNSWLKGPKSIISK